MASTNYAPVPLTLVVNEGRFRALSAGSEGTDLILLLHGFAQFADAWLPVMPAFAAAGFHAVAVDQRGYSPEVRPKTIEAYATETLCADVLGFANALAATRFHLVGQDWGGLLAWQIAAKFPDRLRTLTVLSTPHPDALLDATRQDDDQRQRSRYFEFFRMPTGSPEAYISGDNGGFLRRMYQGKLSEEMVLQNINRLSEPEALTAALNWYRAWDINKRIGPVHVPTLYVWGSDDLAVGAAAASRTERYVAGPYDFEQLSGKSHWLVDEIPDWISDRILRHLRSAND